MKIKVTKKHIAKASTSGSVFNCPAILAMREKLHKHDVFVGENTIYIGDVAYYTPNEVRTFVNRFDDGLKVKPFSFEFDTRKPKG